MSTVFMASVAVFVVCLILAFTPLIEGGEGTWQNSVGDWVWTTGIVTFELSIVLGIVLLVRDRQAGKGRQTSRH